MRPIIGTTALAVCIALTGCNPAPTGNAAAGNAAGLTSNSAMGNTAMANTAGNAAITPTAVSALSGQDFANLLAASDAFEIATSRLALTKATTPGVKAFARKMIDAHTASTDKLKAAVASHQPPITLDATLSADQQQKLDGLKTLTGSAFERIYLIDQVAAHEAALSAVQSYAQSGDVPFLKDVAAGAVAMVTDHLTQARQLSTEPASTG
ncbi:MAG TPA: DUF4142 domain-containing protein [Sphingobium sp.]|nr:DUF4142 domain-containing protein [Sphingobium sp.]